MFLFYKSVFCLYVVTRISLCLMYIYVCARVWIDGWMDKWIYLFNSEYMFDPELKSMSPGFESFSPTQYLFHYL